MSIANFSGEPEISAQLINAHQVYFQAFGTPLDNYIIQPLTLSCTGPYGIHGPVNTTGTATLVGEVVTISINGISASTDNNGVITASPALPALFRPNPTMNFPIWVLEGGTPFLGNCTVDTNGIIVIKKGFGSVFAGASTNVGFQDFQICYCAP